jgi:hypothetical protein
MENGSADLPDIAAVGVEQKFISDDSPGADVFARTKGSCTRWINSRPRKDRTTAAALRVCLEAAQSMGSNIETELIDLGGLKIKAIWPDSTGGGRAG